MSVFFVCTGLLGLLAVVLTLNVGRMRGKKKVFLGDGGDAELIAAIRAHGNLLELTPLCLFTIWLMHGHYGDSFVSILAVVLAVARLLHAGGMLGFIGFGRFAGAVGTTAVMAVAAISLGLSGLGAGH